MRALLGMLAVALLAGCASGGDGPEPTVTVPPEADRLVEITMRDNRFDPDGIEVEAGETIAFAFHNAGAHPHDAFIGNADAQAEHAEGMREGGGLGGHGDGSLTVEPGERGMIVHTFDEDGAFEIGCHQPGHYAVGMVINVEVR